MQAKDSSTDRGELSATTKIVALSDQSRSKKNNNNRENETSIESDDQHWLTAGPDGKHKNTLHHVTKALTTLTAKVEVTVEKVLSNQASISPPGEKLGDSKLVEVEAILHELNITDYSAPTSCKARLTDRTRLKQVLLESSFDKLCALLPDDMRCQLSTDPPSIQTDVVGYFHLSSLPSQPCFTATFGPKKIANNGLYLGQSTSLNMGLRAKSIMDDFALLQQLHGTNFVAKLSALQKAIAAEAKVRSKPWTNIIFIALQLERMITFWRVYYAANGKFLPLEHLRVFLSAPMAPPPSLFVLLKQALPNTAALAEKGFFVTQSFDDLF